MVEYMTQKVYNWLDFNPSYTMSDLFKAFPHEKENKLYTYENRYRKLLQEAKDNLRLCDTKKDKGKDHGVDYFKAKLKWMYDYMGRLSKNILDHTIEVDPEFRFFSPEDERIVSSIKALVYGLGSLPTDQGLTIEEELKEYT